MNQLEVRAYDRQEIAEILNIKMFSHNFIRDVRDKLSKWGYSCETPRDGQIIITRKPESAEERLAEIMNRQFHLDIQIEVRSFACYLHFMLTDPAAQTMPWGVRHDLIQEMYGIKISEVTLRRWTRRLLDGNIMSKSQGTQDAEWWMTYRDSTGKHQEAVDQSGIEKIHSYWDRHSKILSEMMLVFHGDSSKAWSETKRKMWQEYGCCYYRCKCLMINGIGNEEINTIIELVEDILDLHWETSNVDQT